VIAPANTGKDNNNNIAVIKIAQTNRGNLSNVILGALILITVAMKFVAPRIDEAPAMCRLKIAKSTAGPV